MRSLRWVCEVKVWLLGLGVGGPGPGGRWGGGSQDHALLKGLFDHVHKASSIWISSLERLPSPAPLPRVWALVAFSFLLHFGFPSSAFPRWDLHICHRSPPGGVRGSA